ncbi:MAG TPA: ribosome biogenesis GTP-binding protein YihA/YsxC [Bryobacteraceae bacterium]|nr:ribosome biogenesis GTP-binding protein YihA/YsxC [Bryobacteraceae bacterium]
MPKTEAEMTPRLLISAVEPRQFPPERAEQEDVVEIAFLGRSNVGKSSLLNTLVRRPGLAFTSARPGCTQMINFFYVEPGLRFVDLPGYGFARVPLEEKEKWRKLIEAYLLQRQSLQLCFLLLDTRRGWMDMDLELKSWLEFHKRRYVVVATKFDKLKSRNQETTELARIRKQTPDQELIPFSAQDGRGVREIWQTISKIRNKK